MTKHHVGPTPAEERMLAVNDLFYRMLQHRPTEAKRFAYEVEAIAERYQSHPGRKGKAQNGKQNAE